MAKKPSVDLIAANIYVETMGSPPLLSSLDNIFGSWGKDNNFVVSTN